MSCQNPECPRKNETPECMRCSRCKQATYCTRSCQVAHWRFHKTACTSSKPALVVIISPGNEDLFRSVHSDLLSELRSKAQLTYASNAEAISQQLARPEVRRVLIADSDIAEKRHAPLLAQLVQWVRSGGTTVVGGLFSSFIRMNRLDAFFATWGLPWTHGDYYRTTFALNQHARPWLVPDPSPALSTSYSMKAVHLLGVDQQDAVYVSAEDSQIESLVWAPDKVGDQSGVPVAYAQLGQGSLGYVGDVNGEEESTHVIVCMFHL